MLCECVCLRAAMFELEALREVPPSPGGFFVAGFRFGLAGRAGSGLSGFIRLAKGLAACAECKSLSVFETKWTSLFEVGTGGHLLATDKRGMPFYGVSATFQPLVVKTCKQSHQLIKNFSTFFHLLFTAGPP